MLLAFIFACTPAAEIPLPECDQPDGLFVLPSAAVSTMANVTWTGRSDVRTRVEVLDRETQIVGTDWQGEGEHATQLIGIPADSSLTADIVTEDGETLVSCRFYTEPLPLDLETLTLTGQPSWDGLLATSFLGRSAASVVIDEQGAVRWYHLTEPGVLYRTRFRLDGQGVTYLLETGSGNADDVSVIADVGWDGGDAQVLSGDEHPTHDFTALEDGTIGFLTSYEIGDSEAKDIANKLFERTPTGELVELWDTLEDYFPGGVPANTVDWYRYATQGNVVQYEAERDAWWVGMRNVSSIAVVERGSGETLERIGGAYSDWQFGPDAAFNAQHGWDLTENGMVLHDNRDDSEEDSRVIELSMDRSTMRIELESTFLHDPPLFIYAMGEPIRLDDGSTLVSWSTSGLVDQFAPDGTVISSIAAPFGTAFGYIEYHETFPGQVELR